MIILCSLQRAKQWLDVIHDFDDEKIQFQIAAASFAVLDYLGISESDLLDSNGDQVIDSDGNPTDVEEVVQAATCLLVGKLYDGMDPKEMEYGRLPIEVTSMLYIRRQEMGFA